MFEFKHEMSLYVFPFIVSIMYHSRAQPIPSTVNCWSTRYMQCPNWPILAFPTIWNYTEDQQSSIWNQASRYVVYSSSISCVPFETLARINLEQPSRPATCGHQTCGQTNIRSGANFEMAQGANRTEEDQGVFGNLARVSFRGGDVDTRKQFSLPKQIEEDDQTR